MVTQLSVFSFQSLGEEEYIFISGDRFTQNNPSNSNRSTIASKEDSSGMASVCLQQSCPDKPSLRFVFPSRYLSSLVLFLAFAPVDFHLHGMDVY